MKSIDKKKLMFFVPLLALILAFAFVKPAFAQDGTPPTADQVNDITLSVNVMWMIIGGFLVACQRPREGAQERHKAKQFGLEVGVFRLLRMGRRGGTWHHETFFPPFSSAEPRSSDSSIWRSKSKKSSGTGSWATSSYIRRNSRPIAR